ncbi:hypothetical protein MTO96_042136 [Rhipicephalus appendiculatus]
MQIATSERTVACLRELFCRFGVPETVVYDNGPQLVSKEFKAFMRDVGARHLRLTQMGSWNPADEDWTSLVTHKVIVTTPRGKFIWRRHLDQLLAGTDTVATSRAPDRDFTEGFLALPQS